MKFERSVIGSIILDNRAIHEIRSIVNPSDFHDGNLGECLRAAYELSENEKPIDVMTLHAELQKSKYSCEISISGLVNITDHVPSAANLQYYAEAVRDESKRRAVYRIAEAAKDSDSGTQAVDEALKALIDVNKDQKKTQSTINEALIECMEYTEKLFSGDIAYQKTGLSDLDSMIDGFTGGRLYVVGARPAMGKTALALNFVLDAVKNKVPTLVFSMEMPREEITYRMICAATSLSTRAQNNMTEEDWPKLTAGFSILKDQSLDIDDGSGHDIHHIKRSIRSHHAKHGSGFYVIDYLQLMTIRGENRVQGIGQVTRDLKNLARDLNVPILILSQLSRGIEQRPDKRPLMSDLRESGEIEQDADVIIFIYRDEVYNEDTDQKGVAELIVRKYRQGEIGTVRVSSQLQYARFSNISYKGGD